MAERANPDTCEHRIVQLVPLEDSEDHEAVAEAISICVSCDSTLDPEWVGQNHWEYDIDNNVWVWQGRCDCEDDPLDGLTISTVELDTEGRVYLAQDVLGRGVERSQTRTGTDDG